MKEIELTEEHKEKLLEMCKSLFPEYPDVQFGVKEKHNWSIAYLVFGIMGVEPIIHWFEFCVNHLTIKLEISSEDLMTMGLNPIEPLYEQFKYLKL